MDDGIEQTSNSEFFCFYSKMKQQLFAVMMYVSFVVAIMFETFVFYRMNNIEFVVLRRFTIFTIHMAVIFCVSYAIFGLFVLNHCNQLELRQRIDKFGVERKLETMFVLVCIDLFFSLFATINSGVTSGIVCAKTGRLYQNLSFSIMTLSLAFTNFCVLYVTYILHPDMLGRKSRDELERYRAQMIADAQM